MDSIIKNKIHYQSQLLCCLIGCWDRIDIESRALIIGMGIDSPDENEIIKFEQEIEDKDLLKKIKPKYKLSLEILNPQAFQKGSQSSGGGGNAVKKSIAITEEGRSITQAMEKIQPKTDRILTPTHTQLIIINEKIAREGIWEIIDCYIMDPFCPRRAVVLVSSEPAFNILNAQLETKESPSLFINKIIEMKLEGVRIVESSAGKVYNKMITNSGFVVPKVIKTGNNLGLSGAAVFRESKMIGWLNPLELEGQQWASLRGKEEVQAGLVTITDPEDGNNIFVVKILGMQKKIKSVEKNSKITIFIEINVTGEIVYTPHKWVFADKTIKKLEKEMDTTMEKMIKESIKKSKEDFKTDIYGYNELIRENHPEYWKKHKDNWHETFSSNEVDVRVEVKSNIRRMGGLR